MTGFAHAMLQNFGDSLPGEVRDYAQRIIVAVIMGISIVLVPVIGLTARFALKHAADFHHELRSGGLSRPPSQSATDGERELSEPPGTQAPLT